MGTQHTAARRAGRQSSKHTEEQALLHRSTAQVILKKRTPAPPKRRSEGPKIYRDLFGVCASSVLPPPHLDTITFSTSSSSSSSPELMRDSERVITLKQLTMMMPFPFDKSNCPPGAGIQRGCLGQFWFNAGLPCAADCDRLRKSSREQQQLVCPHNRSVAS